MSHNILEGGIGYEGKVTLTLMSNNRVLKTQTYKNNGTAQLFKFLGYCLIGRSNDVENLLPYKIALLFNDSSTSPAAANEYSVQPRSGLMEIAQAPMISSQPEEVKVTYSFELNKSAIFGPINQVALYGYGYNDINEDFGNFSAYYYLADSTKDEFKTEDTENWSATTVLLIDWELSISNKNTEINIS